MDKVSIFNRKKNKLIAVKVKAGAANVKGVVKLELPETWTVSPAEVPFSLTSKGEEQAVFFEVTAPKTAEEISAKAVVIVDGKRFDLERTDINYNHISKQMVLKPSEAKFIKLDIKTGINVMPFSV
jgi:hypothetical protein